MRGSNYYGYPLSAKRTPKLPAPPTPPPFEELDHLEEKLPARRRNVEGDVMKTYRGDQLLKVEKRKTPMKIQPLNTMALPPSTLQQPELINMPDLVLRRIAEYVGFYGVAHLQKVNQRFHDLLEQTVNLNGVKIVMCQNEIDCQYGSEGTLLTQYKKTRDGCQVIIKKYGQEHVKADIPKTDFKKVFFDDIERNFALQKGVLEKLEIHSVGSPDPKFLAKISEFMKVRNNLLQTKTLHLSVCNGEEVRSILLSLDPTKMQDINIRSQMKRPVLLTTLEMDRLASLEQWKMAKNIWMWSDLVVPSSSVQHFLHLTNTYLTVESFGVADFLRLKQKILSLDFNRFHISFKRNLEDKDKIVTLIGKRFEGSILQKYWHFHVPNHEEDVFRVELTDKYLYMDHMDKTKYLNSRRFSEIPVLQPMFEFP